MPNFASAMSARHGGEMFGALKTDCLMPALGENFEIASGPAAEIENFKRMHRFDGAQQSVDVLADIVIAGAPPEFLGMLIIMTQRDGDRLFQILRIEFHGWHLVSRLTDRDWSGFYHRRRVHAPFSPHGGSAMLGGRQDCLTSSEKREPMTQKDLMIVWAPRLLSLLRIVAALLFIEHGTQKLFGFPPSSHPAPAVLSLLWVAAILEALGGVLLLLGLFTRPVAFLLSGEMAFAYWLYHAPNSFFPANNGGDAAILFCFVFLYMAAAGGGAFNLDALRKSP